MGKVSFFSETNVTITFIKVVNSSTEDIGAVKNTNHVRWIGPI